jgi:signal transduction histidine kinase/ActR/RegA family two-component response regulator
VLWPCNGILTAALLLLRPRPAVIVAGMCALIDLLCAYLSGSPPTRALLITGCDLAEAFLAAVLVRRFCGAALDMTSVVRVRNFVLLAALPASLLMGTAGSILAFESDFRKLWGAWVIGDFLGMITGAPTALLLARFRRFDMATPAGAVERILLLIGLSVIAALLFSIPVSPLWALYPIGLLVVIRISPPFATLGVLLIAVIATGLTVRGYGPIATAKIDINSQVLALQAYLATVLLSALILASVLAQKARAQAGLRRALTAAHRARREAVQAAGAKGRFLAVMSHEMRTPLNGIIGYTQLLSSRRDLPAEARDQLAVMQTSSQVLLALINDVLDYSRAESGRLDLTTAPFNLPQVIRETVEAVRPTLADSPVVLRVELEDAGPPWRSGDQRRLSQILLNLLSNAVKFTDHGSITVTAQALDDGESVRLTVEDTGIGVPPEKLDSLFIPFFQADSGDRRNFSGAGLGLTIVQSLAVLMGGSVGAESQENVGSRFWVDLPLPLAEPPAGPEPLAPTALGAGVQPRVLVVDDHPVNRQVAMLMLDAAGFTVETACNGEEAVQAVQDRDFDAVFMDLHMPVMDGLAATRAIRNLDGARSLTPIIAMTAAAMPEDLARCDAAGMDGHISKPIEHAALLEAAMNAHHTPAGKR